MQTEQNPMSLQQKIDLAHRLAFAPALSVMLLLRKNIGYRTLNPLWLMAASGAMCLLAMLAEDTPNASALLIYAFLVLIGGFAERRKRWRELQQGVNHHTYYIGDSHLERLPLPAFAKEMGSSRVDLQACKLEYSIVSPK